MPSSSLHPVGEVLNYLLSQRGPLPSEERPLMHCRGRTLASPIPVQVDAPSFDQSAMDGYAVNHQDLLTASALLPVRLEIDGENAATPGLTAALSSGCARRIFTGAQIPPGATAVVMQENAIREGTSVLLSRPTTAGANIRKQGENQSRGDDFLHAGHRLDPISLGWLASQDLATVKVTRRPRVAILATGSELRAPGSPHRPGTVVDSNRFVLRTYLEELGVECVDLPNADDRQGTLTASLQGLEGFDVIITTGGASVGDHDLVAQALVEAGGHIDFWKMALKPGKPVIIGKLGGAVFLGLPGNPVSAAITFNVFARPLLLCMNGDRKPHPQTLPAKVQGGMRHRPGRLELARADLLFVESGWRATLAPRQSSAAHDAMVHFKSLLVIPPDHGDVIDGQTFQVIPEWGWRGAEASPFRKTT